MSPGILLRRKTKAMSEMRKSTQCPHDSEGADLREAVNKGGKRAEIQSGLNYKGFGSQAKEPRLDIARNKVRKARFLLGSNQY